jgi:hypothetical protein
MSADISALPHKRSYIALGQICKWDEKIKATPTAQITGSPMFFAWRW